MALPNLPQTHIFDADHLNTALAALQSAASGTTVTNGVMGMVDKNGAQVVASWSRPLAGIGARWTLEAVAEHQWKGDNDVQAKVLLTW